MVKFSQVAAKDAVMRESPLRLFSLSHGARRVTLNQKCAAETRCVLLSFVPFGSFLQKKGEKAEGERKKKPEVPFTVFSVVSSGWALGELWPPKYTIMADNSVLLWHSTSIYSELHFHKTWTLCTGPEFRNPLK